MSQATYRRDLVTNVNSLSYDFNTRTGRLVMPDLCATDMTGCIRLFMAIDPAVERIETIAGAEVDTIYTRVRSGWKAARPASGMPLKPIRMP